MNDQKFYSFSEFFQDKEFIDLYMHESHSSLPAITIIIPAVHVNELWSHNLASFYRECRVYELLIGNAGLSDEAIVIAKQFPRVRVLNHIGLTLGYSIRLLINEVSSELFAYFHSDIYLPPGWSEQMLPFANQYDWYGCRMMQTTFLMHVNNYGDRPYAGAQIGKTKTFKLFVDQIDDDYVWRQEDFVFANKVLSVDGKVGSIDHVFHYHQLMPKQSDVWNPDLFVSYTVNLSREQQLKVAKTQLFGLIKYTNHNSAWCVQEAITYTVILLRLEPFNTINYSILLSLLCSKPAWAYKLALSIPKIITELLKSSLRYFKLCTFKFLKLMFNFFNKT